MKDSRENENDPAQSFKICFPSWHFSLLRLFVDFRNKVKTPIELLADKKAIFLNGNVLLVRTWTIILYGWLVIERTKTQFWFQFCREEDERIESICYKEVAVNFFFLQDIGYNIKKKLEICCS